MLEFFSVVFTTNKFQNEKIRNKEKIENMVSDMPVYMGSRVNINVVYLLAGLITLVMTLYAIRLALNCNKNKSSASLFVLGLFVFMFPTTYLIYYFIWRVLLQNRCPK